MTQDLPVPIFDNHVHLDPRGDRGEAVKEFHRAGGTHLMLVHKPYEATPKRTVEAHVDGYETTLGLAEEAREAADVQVLVALGPHPVEFTKLLDEGVDRASAMEVYRGALEAAGRFIEEGDACCLGEVGRPHWRPVDEEVLAASNELLVDALRLARDLDVPVQIHAETATPESYAELADLCDEAGLPRHRAIKHYSSPIIDEEGNAGLVPSVLVGGDNAREAADQGTRFLMETDYLDDPDRPGAVLGPKTVPKRTRSLFETGAMTEEGLHRVHVDLVEELYGVEVDAA